jgi:hypothetical protein
MSASVELRALATRMQRVFVGNNFCHYTADFRNTTTDPHSGKIVPQYADVSGAPTVEEFIAHLEGRRGLLVVPVTQAGACRWGKIDIDEYPVDARKYAAAVKRWGLPLVVEMSKSGGVHLAHYSPYTESAADLRAKLADWAAALHCPKGVEIFPKQERLLDGEKGTGINLPYFGGDGAQCKNYALAADGTRLTVGQWLDIIERMPAKAAYVAGQVNVEAASDLLGRHWVEGTRDNLNLAAAGALLRAGVECGLVQEVLDGASRIGADGAPRRSALSVEQALHAGDKRIPGFPALAEIIGVDTAREFMRLAGGRPPSDPLPLSFLGVSAEWLNCAPPAVTYCIEPLLPTGVVGLLVAEGGAGKTTFGLRAAISVAGGRDLFGLPTKMGRAVYLACEEHDAALRRRVYWIVERERARMRAENASLEAIELFEQNLLANLVVQSAVGYELYLVSARNGEASQSGMVEALIENLPRPVDLLILDPISRLNGGEENSNQIGTALINAGERIARELDCTLLFCHHTGKAAAKERGGGMYDARGASGLVDAARSSIRLMAADAADVKDFTNVPPGLVEAGDLIRVLHNKSNEGPRAPAFWLRRQALDFERFTPELADGPARARSALAALYDWFLRNGRVPFSAKRFDDAATRDSIWHKRVGRNEARALIAAATDAGDLVPLPVVNKGAHVPLLTFREGYEPEPM